MSAVTEAPFYDLVMVEADSPAMLPLLESPWRPLYEEAAGWIPVHEDVVDLGCGTGRFLHALYAQGHYAPTCGIDFSARVLTEAERYHRPLGWETPPTFAQQDLREWHPEPTRAGNTVYVCLETLEHLQDDVALVRRIPPGHRFIFSVPNYDSEAHIRTFRSVGSVWKQYGRLVNFRRWSLIELDGPRRAVHVCETVRKADSW